MFVWKRDCVIFSNLEILQHWPSPFWNFYKCTKIEHPETILTYFMGHSILNHFWRSNRNNFTLCWQIQSNKFFKNCSLASQNRLKSKLLRRVLTCFDGYFTLNITLFKDMCKNSLNYPSWKYNPSNFYFVLVILTYTTLITCKGIKQ